MLSFSTGLSALRASQAALDTIAHNVANANDPNYHRQVTDQASRPGIEQNGFFFGNGVDITAVRRLRDENIAGAISRNISETRANDTRLGIARQLESTLSPSAGSLNNRLDEFLNELERLSASPSDATARGAAVKRAESLARELNSVATSLTELALRTDAQIADVVRNVNDLAEDVADLNLKIAQSELKNELPNDLLDARDRLLNELSQLLEAQVHQQGDAPSYVILADHGLIGQNYSPLEAYTSNGQVFVRQSGDQTPLNIQGGKLAGLLDGRNRLIGELKDRVDRFAHELIRAVNENHATGVGLAGPFRRLQGTTSVNDQTAVLNNAQLPFDVSAGSLFISVLDQSSGERTQHEIQIDPAAQSLDDVAAAISAIDHLQAVVEAPTGRLTIFAEADYAFDFTGALETHPQTATISGSTEVTFHGAPSGQSNETYTFSIPTAGTVGVTAGLAVEVRNAAGQLVTTLDVGDGYEVGSPLQVADGLAVSFDSGDFGAGDSFSTTLAAEPDSSGLLVALGLNNLFVGRDAATIGLHSAIKKDPNLLATSRSGQPGDITNLQAMLEVRQQLRFGNSDTTASAEIQDLVSSSGFSVAELSLVEEQLTLARQHLDDQRNSLSGVDPNEELVHMLEFQRAFQVASRFISTIDQTLADLLAIVG